jgi:GNAT superfamily N-acetyltransferase
VTVACVRIAGVRIEVRTYDHPDAVALIADVQQEYVVRYGDQDQTPVDPAEFSPPQGLFVVAYVEDVPAACGGWRAHGTDVELKRMYVRPSFRGRGLARAGLAELERAAAAAGFARYTSAGYTPVPSFGYYANAPEAVHLGKELEVACPSTP